MTTINNIIEWLKETKKNPISIAMFLFGGYLLLVGGFGHLLFLDIALTGPLYFRWIILSSGPLCMATALVWLRYDSARTKQEPPMAGSPKVEIFTRANRDTFNTGTKALLQQAQEEVWLSGGTLEKILGRDPEVRDIVNDKTQKHCVFKLLMPAPANPHLSLLEAYVGGEQPLVEPIEDRIQRCILYHAGLANSYLRLELLRNTFMPYRLLIIDPDTPDGLCRVEFYLYRRDAQCRPSFIVTKKDHPDLFDLYYTQFDTFWTLAQQERAAHEQQAALEKQQGV